MAKFTRPRYWLDRRAQPRRLTPSITSKPLIGREQPLCGGSEAVTEALTALSALRGSRVKSNDRNATGPVANIPRGWPERFRRGRGRFEQRRPTIVGDSRQRLLNPRPKVVLRGHSQTDRLQLDSENIWHGGLHSDEALPGSGAFALSRPGSVLTRQAFRHPVKCRAGRGHRPQQPSVVRVVGTVSADVHDDWQADDRRSPSEGSMELLQPQRYWSRRRTHTRRLTPRITSKPTTQWGSHGEAPNPVADGPLPLVPLQREDPPEQAAVALTSGCAA